MKKIVSAVAIGSMLSGCSVLGPKKWDKHPAYEKCKEVDNVSEWKKNNGCKEDPDANTTG